MTSDPSADSVLGHAPGLVVEGFDDGLLLWNENYSRLHHLDLTAAIVWESLDGRLTLAEVSRSLAEELRCDEERIAADVLRLAATLVSEGLLQPRVAASRRGHSHRLQPRQRAPRRT